MRKSFFNTPSLLGKFLVIVWLSCFGMALPNEASAQPLQTYRYDLQTKASEFAKKWFGPTRASERSQNLNMGNARIGVSTELDCGKLDIRANIRGAFNKLVGERGMPHIKLGRNIRFSVNAVFLWMEQKGFKQ